MSLYTLAMRAFCGAWELAYGVPYIPTPADCKQLRTLTQHIPPRVAPELPLIFTRYVQDDDPYVAQAMRHSLLHFCTRGGLNKYRVTAPVLSAKEARAREAARQFVNGEGK